MQRSNPSSSFYSQTLATQRIENEQLEAPGPNGVGVPNGWPCEASGRAVAATERTDTR